MLSPRRRVNRSTSQRIRRSTRRARLVGLALAFAALSLSTPAVPAIAFTEQPWGRLGIAHLSTAPYPHPSRDEGFASAGDVFPRDPHYIDSSVAFLVPRGYAPGGAVDLVVHFHGHSNHLRRLIPMFQLGEQLEASGVNAILIVPQGPWDARDSRFGKLDEPGGFAAFVAECLQALRLSGATRTERLGRIILMGHSGGYYTLGQIIANGDLADHVAELWLWDATYAQLAHFADFAARPGTRVRSIFTGHLAEENVDLMCDLQRRGVPFLFSHDTLVTDEQLASERIVFMHTDLGHNDVVMGTRHLERWLRASTLPRRPPQPE